MTSVRGLVLDYGDVLSRPHRLDAFQPMAQRLGVTLDALRAAYWQHRRAYDGGLPAADYWRRVLDTAGVPGGREARAVEPLVAADVASWTDYREEVWTLAQAFRAAGGRTAFLSNGVPEIVAHLRQTRGLDSAFDAVVVSCEVGLLKPDPAIFRLCLDRLGVAPDRALFVDDRVENVEAAGRLGIRTLHFTGDDAVPRLRAMLSS